MKAEESAKLVTDWIREPEALPTRKEIEMRIAEALRAHANEALERAALEVALRCQNPLVPTRPCGGCPWCNVGAAIRALKE